MQARTRNPDIFTPPTLTPSSLTMQSKPQRREPRVVENRARVHSGSSGGGSHNGHRSQASTDALRASVLDAALQLGFTANPTVAGWLFNQPSLPEEKEDDVDFENATSPSLTSASTDESSAPYTPPTVFTQSPSTGFQFNSLQNKRHLYNYPGAVNIQSQDDTSFDGHTESTHSHAISASHDDHAKVPAFAFLSKPPTSTPNKNKLKKKRKGKDGGGGYDTDGYLSEAGGYKSEGGKSGAEGYDTDASGYLSSSSKKSKKKKGFFARLGRSKTDTDEEDGLGDEQGYQSEASAGKSKSEKKEKEKKMKATKKDEKKKKSKKSEDVPPMPPNTGPPQLAPIRSRDADVHDDDDWGLLPPIAERFATTLGSRSGTPDLTSREPVLGVGSRGDTTPTPTMNSYGLESSISRPDDANRGVNTTFSSPLRPMEVRTEVTSRPSPVGNVPSVVGAVNQTRQGASASSASSPVPTFSQPPAQSTTPFLANTRPPPNVTWASQPSVSSSTPSPVSSSGSPVTEVHVSPLVISKKPASTTTNNRLNISLPLSRSLSASPNRPRLDEIVSAPVEREPEKASTLTNRTGRSRPSLPPIFVGPVPSQDAAGELKPPRNPIAASEQASPVIPSSAFLVPSPGFQQQQHPSEAYLSSQPQSNGDSLNPPVSPMRRPASPGGTPWVQRSLSKRPSTADQLNRTPSKQPIMYSPIRGPGAAIQRPWQTAPPPSPPPTSPLPPPPPPPSHLNSSPSTSSFPPSTPYPAPTGPLPSPPTPNRGSISAATLPAGRTRVGSTVNVTRFDNGARSPVASRVTSPQPPPVAWRPTEGLMRAGTLQRVSSQPTLSLRERPSLPDMRMSTYTDEGTGSEESVGGGPGLGRTPSQVQRGRQSPFPTKPLRPVGTPERRFGRVNTLNSDDSPFGGMGSQGGREQRRKRVAFEMKVEEPSDGEEDGEEVGLAYDRSSYVSNNSQTSTQLRDSVVLDHIPDSLSRRSYLEDDAADADTSTNLSKYTGADPRRAPDNYDSDSDDASIYTAGRTTMYFEDDLVNVDNALEDLLALQANRNVSTSSVRPDSEFLDHEVDARSMRTSRGGPLMDDELSGEVRDRFVRRVMRWKEVQESNQNVGEVVAKMSRGTEEEERRRADISFEERQVVNAKLSSAMRGGLRGLSPVPPVPAVPVGRTADIGGGGMGRGVPVGAGRGVGVGRGVGSRIGVRF